MIAEAKNLPRRIQIPGTTQVNVTVTVTPPQGMGQPVVTFTGLNDNHNQRIETETADFTLTMVLAGEGSATFAPLTLVPGPITWLSPGQLQEVPQPSYITDLALSQDQLTLTFTDTNTSTVPGIDVLVSFLINYNYIAPGGEPMLFTSRDILFSSPDPTIINVDPPVSLAEPARAGRQRAGSRWKSS
ncbi:MAG TPA: hypothetical protein VGH73_03040 [Thermoanaerobaculia bacterium]|jgi:hypothetical protein